MTGTHPTIAITGAGGMIGSALCHHFAAAGYRVHALSRRPIEDPPEGAIRFPCDLPDQIAPESLAGCSVVIHGAYVTRAMPRRDAQRINEEGTRRLFELSRKADVERFIFISSVSARPDARSYYGRSKFQLERLLDPRRDLAIRPGFVLAKHAGLFARTVGMIRDHRVIPLPGRGDQPIQTLHIDDLCVAMTAAIEHRVAGIVTVAEPDPIRLRDLLALIAGHLKRRVTFVPMPVPAVLAVIRAAELLRFPLAATSDNLLGLITGRPIDTRPDEQRLGMSVRPATLSLDQLLTTA
jgi:nucleoside-diphosphate-sugar epimerase